MTKPKEKMKAFAEIFAAENKAVDAIIGQFETGFTFVDISQASGLGLKATRGVLKRMRAKGLLDPIGKVPSKTGSKAITKYKVKVKVEGNLVRRNKDVVCASSTPNGEALYWKNLLQVENPRAGS